MIGHVFEGSSATLLALAPSANRPDEYILIAKTEIGYAVADILAADLGKIGGPTSWMRGEYFFHGTREDNLRSAAGMFVADTGLSDIDHVVAAVEHAEQVAEHRAHLAGA